MADEQIILISIRVEKNIEELIGHIDQYIKAAQDQKAKETSNKIRSYCDQLIKALRKVRRNELKQFTVQEAVYLKKIEHLVVDMIKHKDHYRRDMDLLTQIQQLLDELNKKEEQVIKQEELKKVA